jgi:hypothetical protein
MTLTPHDRRRRFTLLVTGIGCSAVLSAASVAGAASGDYVTRSFDEPVARGLAVQPPLSTFLAISRARVVVPADWQRVSAPAGRLSFLTPGGSCRYRVTFTIHTRVADPADPVAYVAAGLPAGGARYLLDNGQRSGSAFRTVRRPGTDTRVRLAALRASVLTRRADIVSGGQVAWSELRAAATSRVGDECHSGSYRQRVGPQISDTMATARATLAFERPKG